MKNLVLDCIASRRSIRKYKDRPLEPSVLETLLQAAIQAPSAANRQPWFFTVIRDRELLREITDGVSHAMERPEMNCLFEAPAAVIVSCDAANPWSRADCGMATQNFLLAAESLGIGTCVVGFVMRYLADPAGAGTLKKLEIPEGYAPLYAIAVGYPSEKPEARPRKDTCAHWIPSAEE